MALASSGRVVITDAAKVTEPRQNMTADSRVFFTGPPRWRVSRLRNPAYLTAKRRITRPCRPASRLESSQRAVVVRRAEPTKMQVRHAVGSRGDENRSEERR